MVFKYRIYIVTCGALSGGRLGGCANNCIKAIVRFFKFTIQGIVNIDMAIS